MRDFPNWPGGPPELPLRRETPMNADDSGGKSSAANPAMPLLYALGICGVILGLVAIPAGLFAGPQLLVTGVVLVVLSSLAIGLAGRRYGHMERYATIAWSAVTLTVVAGATLWQPPSGQDRMGAVWVVLLLLMAAAVLLIAVRKPPAQGPG